MAIAGGQHFRSKVHNILELIDTYIIDWRVLHIAYCSIFIRKWLEMENKFFLVGIVTGNPSRSCDRKTLPDVYNFVANEKVY